MKKVNCFLSVLVLLLCSQIQSSKAQVYLDIYATQPASLEADAGEDTLICENGIIIIGGVPAADGGTGLYTYLWSPAVGLSSSSIPNPMANVSDTITYTLTVTDQAACVAMSSITLFTEVCTGIPENQQAASIFIYPNPNDGKFTISLFGAKPGSEYLLYIYDESGREVYSDQVLIHTERQDLQIDLSRFAKGNYAISLIWEDTKIIKSIIMK